MIIYDEFELPNNTIVPVKKEQSKNKLSFKELFSEALKDKSKIQPFTSLDFLKLSGDKKVC